MIDPKDKQSNLSHFWLNTVKRLKSEIDEVDVEDFEDPQSMAEYAKDVCSHMLRTESINSAKIGYMLTQTDINEKMRAILVDWLIEVHYKFKLLPETLFLTVNLIDRFLEREAIHRTKL